MANLLIALDWHPNAHSNGERLILSYSATRAKKMLTTENEVLPVYARLIKAESVTKQPSSPSSSKESSAPRASVRRQRR